MYGKYLNTISIDLFRQAGFFLWHQGDTKNNREHQKYPYLFPPSLTPHPTTTTLWSKTAHTMVWLRYWPASENYSRLMILRINALLLLASSHTSLALAAATDGFGTFAWLSDAHYDKYYGKSVAIPCKYFSGACHHLCKSKQNCINQAHFIISCSSSFSYFSSRDTQDRSAMQSNFSTDILSVWMWRFTCTNLSSSGSSS